MKEYKFTLDTKNTIWDRIHFSIEAKNKKEAIRIAKKQFDEDLIPENNSCEYLIKTAEILDVLQNDGFATKELFDEDMNLLKDNL